MGHYKDVGVEYAYQRRLRRLGYECYRGFRFGCGFGWSEMNPQVFSDKYQPEWNSPRKWRKAIKEFIENETFIPKKYADYKIVKAVGYWRDLWHFVYEIWVR